MRFETVYLPKVSNESGNYFERYEEDTYNTIKSVELCKSSGRKMKTRKI